MNDVSSATVILCDHTYFASEDMVVVKMSLLYVSNK